MQRLPQIIIVLLLFGFNLLEAQSPHGPKLTIDCAKCHSPESWKFNNSLGLFSHDSTRFSLKGQHKQLDCISCHATLVFDQAKSNCNSCHADVHNQTVGLNCDRCHTANSWIVENITEIHQRTSFPLIGVHKEVNCNLCHKSASGIQFNPIGVDCIDCHKMDYTNAQSPDHKKNNFSTNCIECHSVTGNGWNTNKVDHSFFPLVQGHDIKDCAACHKSSVYKEASRECITCHKGNFESTLDPNHKAASFSNDCAKCHTLAPGWKPARFEDHDGTFPIYSGKHKGTWVQCMDCHKNQNDFSSFTCISCHQKTETGNAHQLVGSYTYEDQACLACHPKGSADDAFDHNATGFPLTGAHIGLECSKCHTNGFKGTPSACVACHQNNFNNTLNPNHKLIGISTECAVCHTTQPGWSPAKFDDHNSFYNIQGAHIPIAKDCKACHNGNYNNTPNTCTGCHQKDYENTKNPNHKDVGFPNDCATCHSQNAWEPANYNHDGLYFPIYSGKHKGVWSQCLECHDNPANFKQFTCISCHKNPETNQNHNGVSGYVYDNSACLSCHPTGEANVNFNHNATAFPLTGAHQQANCLQCHANGYKGTSTVCVDCHQKDFDQSLNPNHKQIGLSADCASCHTTQPGWAPAQFGIHNSFYAIQGAHVPFANDCKACHNGNYISTPNTCVGCHQKDYNNSTNPNHLSAQFPTDCASCHSQNAWEPSTFNHDGQYFPVYSGKHKGVWNQCNECHDNPGNFAQFTCVSCHKNPETDQNHNGVTGYIYESNACLGCHPTGVADLNFDHAAAGFPLVGGHQTVDCKQCHVNGYKGTSPICVDCHQKNFDQSVNPNHKALNFPTDCKTCHTTAPGWEPAQFDIHDNYYVLTGAHTVIAKDCKACHANGNFNNTPKDCVGCHQQDYNNSADPKHKDLNFPTDCASCHTTATGWSPATFNIHNNYYPLNGAHATIASDCKKCHQNGYNNTPNTCVGCHDADYKATKNPDHALAQFPNDCAACHNEKNWAPSTFNHDGLYFPIYSGKHKNEWDNCVDCHTNPSSYKEFSCTGCHLNPQTDNDHNGVGGYTYESYACFACHPKGDKSMAFNHNLSQFPLTGAHVTVDCKECHKTGFKNTPTECNACHNSDYLKASNPSHSKLGISTNCITCHTTAPGWSPAKFDDHDNYFTLTGAHKTIANDCFACHKGNYNNTPKTCVGCHDPDYKSSINPNHVKLNLSKDCATCHTTDPGWSPASFAVHNNYFVLDGAHAPIAGDCFVCHKGDYNNTPKTCVGCHLANYNSSSNPSHTKLNLSKDCATCHTTQPNWEPATFSIHNNYYVLAGAHVNVACVNCHNGNYNSTPNTCFGCHESDYNGATNPNHKNAQFPTTCATCHTQSAWVPSTFNHDGLYFPIYSGKHKNEWNVCSDCHNNSSDYKVFTCLTCHKKSETDSDHNGVGGYSYNSNACYSCHPKGKK